MKKLNRVLFCTTAVGVCGLASVAMAAPLGGASEQASSVQEVVVTAQRRSEVLENVPMSISVITPEAVRNSGVTNFMQLGQVATGAQMNFAGSVPGVSVRGVSSLIAGYNVETNVAVYIDGFYDPQPITMASDLANLESIEILKGPQGTLYGRNATGGAVLINTLGPSSVLTGRFDASYASFHERVFNGYIAGPIGDRVRYSLAAHYDAGDSSTRLASPVQPGASRGPAVKYELADLRGKLQVDLTDGLEATLGLHLSYLNDPRVNMYSVFTHVQQPFAPPPLRPVKIGQQAYNHSIPQFGYVYEPTLKLVYDTPIGVLTSYTGYARRKIGLNFDYDGTYVDLFYFKVRYQQDTFQESLDYNITAIKNLDLSVGANYYHDRINTPDPNQGLRVYSLGAFAQNSSQDQKTDSWAAYVDGTYHLTDRLSINAGARYSYDKRSMSYETLGPGGVAYLPFTSDKDSWSAFTPRASIRYELAPRTNVYFAYSQGYRAGAYNPSGPDATGRLIPAKPEKIKSYEVGFKTNGRFVRFSSAVFYYDYTDLQVIVIVPDPILGTVSLLKNAPKAEIYGWDNELTITPTERLTIHAGLELLHARFGSFTNATGIGVDATNTFNIGGQTQNWTGLQMARAPDYSGNIGFDYTQPISYGSLFLTANLTYTSSYPVSNPSVYGPEAPVALRRKQRFLQDGFVLLSAQLSWTDPSDHYTVTVFGNNLTDKTYRLSYEGGALGDTGVLADPRTYGVKVGYKF